MIYSVGSIFLDHIINIKSFPKKPVKIFAKGIEKRLGGSAAIASFTIKKLGLDISFIGRFGDDDAFGSGALDDEGGPMNDGFNSEDTTDEADDSDPFGDDSDPFGDDADPFGDDADPFGDGEDPFGS